jgi:hypothetical protein
VLALDPGTVDALRRHREHQDAERARLAEIWILWTVASPTAALVLPAAAMMIAIPLIVLSSVHEDVHSPCKLSNENARSIEFTRC